MYLRVILKNLFKALLRCALQHSFANLKWK